MRKNKILVIQWGRKGAGPKLAYQLALELKDLGNDIFVSVSDANEFLTENNMHFRKKILTLSINSKWKLFSPWHAVRSLKKYKIFLDRINPDLILFVMPHPWDIFISGNCPTLRIIHDANRHPGDGRWPTNRSLKRRIILSSQSIALSEYVGEKIKAYGKTPIVSSHPILNFQLNTPTRERNIDVLVIGRQKKYKGTNKLIAAWPLILLKFPNANLVIAGEGRIDRELFNQKNVTIKNYWLTEYEIRDLLSQSKCVLFPYIEASQSGLLPSALAYGAQSVVTPVGGLIEQAKHLGGMISESTKAEDIASSVIQALREYPNICARSIHEEHKSQLAVAINEFVGNLVRAEPEAGVKPMHI